MTFSLLDMKRRWHLSSPIFTPDRSHFASLVLPEVAVPGTPGGQCIYLHPDPSHHFHNQQFLSYLHQHLPRSPCSSSWPQTLKL